MLLLYILWASAADALIRAAQVALLWALLWLAAFCAVGVTWLVGRAWRCVTSFS